MLDFCIIGSGISGSTIAHLLSKKYNVEILDKARGLGGRASNKRFNKNQSFDHGVQYISPKSKEFKKFIELLYKKKQLKIWDGNHLDLTFKKKEIVNKFIGSQGNNVISKYYTQNIKKKFQSAVKSILYNKYFWEIKLDTGKIVKAKSVIFTCPYPQLKRIAGRYLEKKFLKLKIIMEPNITTMIAFKNQKEVPISSIKFNDNVLTWAANENSKKRFSSSNSLWTLQSSVKWARKSINIYKKNKNIENKLISKFLDFTGYKKDKIIFKKTHGWKYSYNFQSTPYKSYWNKKIRIGVCADWLIGPKVESAWLSANDLAKKIK
tara:strand:- start:251 stop:1213 length:963 start_codon:yes stop_codon:yes gene_type:complete